MRVRLNTRLLSLAIAITGVIALPTAALAYAPDGDDFVTCVPEDAEVEDEVNCTVGLFDPGTDVTVEISEGADFSGAATGGTVVADENGEADFSFTATVAGPVNIGLSGTRNGEPTTVDAAVEVEEEGTRAAAAAEDDLADTGSDTGVLAIVAIGAIAVGGGALVASRRQRATA